MDKKHIERLKDIIIDYTYDYCFAEKICVIEGGGHRLTYDVDQKLDKDDPLYKMIVGSENASFKYETRNAEYCEIIKRTDDNNFSILQKFRKRAERQGILTKSLSQFSKETIDAIQHLCDKSFLVRDQPIDTKIKLSEKGLKHYENRDSFEYIYFNKTLAKKADNRSKWGLGIAFFAVFVSVLHIIFSYS